VVCTGLLNLGGLMKRVAMAVVAVVLLSGCAAGSSAAPDAVSAAPSVSVSVTPTPTPTATSLPAGKFKLTTVSGAEVTFTLPTPVTHPAVKDLEALRVKAGGAPVAYLVAEVDNRKGTERVNMYQVDAFSEDGEQFQFSDAAALTNLWAPNYGADGSYTLPSGKVLDAATGDALSREATEVHNKHIGDAEKGAKTTIVLASSNATLPKEFTRVAVQPSGGGEGEEATPAP